MCVPGDKCIASSGYRQRQLTPCARCSGAVYTSKVWPAPDPSSMNNIWVRMLRPACWQRLDGPPTILTSLDPRGDHAVAQTVLIRPSNPGRDTEIQWFKGHTR